MWWAWGCRRTILRRGLYNSVNWIILMKLHIILKNIVKHVVVERWHCVKVYIVIAYNIYIGIVQPIYVCKATHLACFEIASKTMFTPPWEPTCGRMLRRVVVPPAHQSSNPRFDTGVSHLGGIFFSGRRRSRRQRGACGDFVNLKTQIGRASCRERV